MFAKQPSSLSKHQNELPPDRRPGSTGPTLGANNGSTGTLNPSTQPLQPTSQNTASAQAKSVAAPPVEPDAGATGSRLIVGPDVKLKGAEILDCDTLVVEGRVEATMDSRVIRITEEGSFSGKVGIDIAEIYGEFDGELTARHQLIIHASGRVSGKIRYGKLLVEEGGSVSGDVQTLSGQGASSGSAYLSSLSENQARGNASANLEKEVPPVKSHLSTVAG